MTENLYWFEKERSRRILATQSHCERFISRSAVVVRYTVIPLPWVSRKGINTIRKAQGSSATPRDWHRTIPNQEQSFFNVNLKGECCQGGVILLRRVREDWIVWDDAFCQPHKSFALYLSLQRQPTMDYTKITPCASKERKKGKMLLRSNKVC